MRKLSEVAKMWLDKLHNFINATAHAELSAAIDRLAAYEDLGPVEEFAALKKAKSDGKASPSSNVGKPKCTWPDGTEIKPDGVHGLDPCIYVERQILHNVDITIGECEKCGAINIFWRKTANTETVYEDENFVRRSNS